MYAYLILGLLLLVTMAWFVLHPFLEPATAGKPPVVLPPAAAFRATPLASAATAASVVDASAVTPDAPTDPPVAAHLRTPDELRAEIEAAIAARKAAMMRHSCAGCGATTDVGDAFCRSCGTRVKE